MYRTGNKGSMNSHLGALIHPKFLLPSLSIPAIPKTPLSKTLIHTTKTLKTPNISFSTHHFLAVPVLRCCKSSSLSSIKEHDDTPSTSERVCTDLD